MAENGTPGSFPDPRPAEEKSRPGWPELRAVSKKRWLYLSRLFTRKERLQLGVAALIAAAALVVLIARTVERVTVIAPAVGGRLREAVIGEPRFINPLYASSDTDRDLASLVFGRLIRYDAAGAPRGDLAESFSVSPDGKTYTVRLRTGIMWHDGEAFGADDVLFTIRTIQNPEYKSVLRQNWQGVSVEKTDDRTVRFQLRQPYAPFLENLSVGIIPRHLWQRIPADAAILSDLNIKPVGTGPYQFVRFTRREDGTVTSVVLARNSNFYLPGPYLSEIQFVVEPTADAAVAAYRKNQVDSFVIPAGSALHELSATDASLYRLELPKVFAVFLNSTSVPALGRKAVRQALAMALDRQNILAQTAGEQGVVANAAIPPGSFGANPDIPPIPYDPAKARELLSRDGWKSSGGRLERIEGSGRTRKIQRLELAIATSDASELTRAAELVAEMWNAVGVKTSVKILPLADLQANVIRARAYDGLLFGEVFGHDPDPFAFWHTSQIKDPGLNVALYSNRAADKLLEEARRNSDPTVRAAKYRDFQKLVSEDVGAVFLYSPAHFYAVRKTVSGVAIGAVALPEERFTDVARWHERTSRTFRRSP